MEVIDLYGLWISRDRNNIIPRRNQYNIDTYRASLTL